MFNLKYKRIKNKLKLFLILSIIYCFGCDETKQTYPNILFIAIDDLRPELGCYGKDYIFSPNIDKLASEGILFTNYFATVPTCGASRYSLLTGKLPCKITDLDNDVFIKELSKSKEKKIPETFIHQFRRNGYYTVGIGKISHYPDGYLYGYMEAKSASLELPYSWDEMLLDDDKWGTGHNAFFGYSDGSNRNSKNNQVKPFESADVPDEGYPDGLTTNLAIKKLQELKNKNQPFFLGIGFFKPHLPFNSPKKYWDLYDETQIPLAISPFIPINSSKESLQKSGEFNQYKLGEDKAGLEKSLSDAYARKLKHAYFAAVSYIDAQVGKLMEELKKSGLDKNTIVVIWGDHGFHLGDQLVWGKHTIFENALKSVLIIKSPYLGKNKIQQIVSTVDIYPTLMELSGIKTNYHLDGQSMLSLMLDLKDSKWRNTAYSYFNRGISLRSDQYRMSKYIRDQKQEIELYNLYEDPNETKNIVLDHPEIVESLLPILENGNTGLYK